MANKNMNGKLYVNFTDSSGTGTDLYLVSGENLSTSLGKVSKFIKDNQGGGGGDLAAHIATHVEDTNGVHGIRVYNGTLEVWNEYTQTWCDPSVLGYSMGNVSNLAVISSYRSLTISWTDPTDTTNAIWDGTKVVVKEGSYPENETDGSIIIDSKVKDQYSINGLLISNLTLNTTYYIQLFPYTNKGKYTYSSDNRISGEPGQYRIMTVVINKSTKTVSYANDATDLQPQSSEIDDFIGLYPVMLDSDGNEIGRLNPNNYKQFIDGTSSGITEPSAIPMVAFPRRGVKFERPNSNILKISITDNPNASDFTYDLFSKSANNDCDKVYICIYTCNSTGYCYSGSTINTTNYFKYSKFTNMKYIALQYLTYLRWLRNCSLSNDTYVPTSSTSGTNGQYDESGLYIGNNQNKMFGLENVNLKVLLEDLYIYSWSSYYYLRYNNTNGYINLEQNSQGVRSNGYAYDETIMNNRIIKWSYTSTSSSNVYQLLRDITFVPSGASVASQKCSGGLYRYDNAYPRDSSYSSYFYKRYFYAHIEESNS